MTFEDFSEFVAHRFATGPEGRRALADYARGEYPGVWPVSGDGLAVARKHAAELAGAGQE